MWVCRLEYSLKWIKNQHYCTIQCSVILPCLRWIKNQHFCTVLSSSQSSLHLVTLWEVLPTWQPTKFACATLDVASLKKQASFYNIVITSRKQMLFKMQQSELVDLVPSAQGSLRTVHIKSTMASAGPHEDELATYHTEYIHEECDNETPDNSDQ